VVWLLVELGLRQSNVITRQVAITGVICLIFYGYAMLRYLYWRCPRCGYPFQAGWMQGPWTFLPRKECIHCGLLVGTDPDNLPNPHPQVRPPNSFHEKAGLSQDGFGVSLCGS
jgi:hypothetical protein